jgi:hypothetical protein
LLFFTRVSFSILVRYSCTRSPSALDARLPVEYTDIQTCGTVKRHAATKIATDQSVSVCQSVGLPLMCHADLHTGCQRLVPTIIPAVNDWRLRDWSRGPYRLSMSGAPSTYMDHTGCQQPVSSTTRLTRVTRVTHSRGCQIAIGYVAHTGCDQLGCRLQQNNQKLRKCLANPTIVTRRDSATRGPSRRAAEVPRARTPRWSGTS